MSVFVPVVISAEPNAVPIKFVAAGPSVVPCRISVDLNAVPVREVTDELPFVPMNDLDA